MDAGVVGEAHEGVVEELDVDDGFLPLDFSSGSIRASEVDATFFSGVGDQWGLV